MTNITINDLEQNAELDRKALRSIRGGWGLGLGDVLGGAVKYVTGSAGAIAGGAIGGAVGGIGGIFTRKTSFTHGFIKGSRFGFAILGGKPYRTGRIGGR